MLIVFESWDNLKDKKLFKKYVFIAVIAVTILFIWSNSLKNSSSSMNSSNSIKSLILSIFEYFGFDIKDTFFIHFIRKFGHFAEYFILGFELIIFRNAYYKDNKTALLNCFYIGAFSAFLDETIQLIPSLGRSAQVTDVWIDISGVLLAFLIIIFIRFLSNKIHSKRK